MGAQVGVSGVGPGAGGVGICQDRLQGRMQTWMSLTPEERSRAREQYRNLQRIPPEKREALRQKWNAYKELPSEEKERFTEAAKKPPVKPVAPKAAPAPAAAPKAAAGAAGAVAVKAPMPGNILDVKVAAGASVKAGDVLVILEAMKMENEIVAPQDGTVASINVNKGDTVNSGDVLVSMN